MVLTFRVERRATGSPWLVYDDGRERPATEQEIALWDALEAARQEVAGLRDAARAQPARRGKP